MAKEDSSAGHAGEATAQIARLREQVEALMRCDAR
jgi:hypothetical protein